MNLTDIRDNTKKARSLMARTKVEHFAVGAFNVDDQATLIAIAEAAQKMQAPVLVEVSHEEAKSIGLKNIRDMVNNYKSEYGIQMYLNLDHAPTIEDCIEAIDVGFEFIHIDISQADHEADDKTIIEATKKVVHYAAFTGALVESEPHYFGGSSNLHKEAIDYDEIRKTFSTPEGAKWFVDETGIDTFAAAIGNLHGKYAVPKQLDIELLKKIRAAIDCNISLHGGSGTPIHYYKEACQNGIGKVNINSDMRIVYRQTLEKALAENPDQYSVLKLMGQVRQAVSRIVEEKIKAFGSLGKAVN